MSIVRSQSTPIPPGAHYCVCRISPHHSPAPPERRSQPSHAAEAPSSHLASASAPEPEPELDLTTPPPVEETLAARRAKRQAILAKYAGSINTAPTATPSPEPSSAAEPPTATSTVSDHTSSRLQSAAVTPPASVTPGASVPPDGKLTPPKIALMPANDCIQRQTRLHVGISCS